MGNSGCGDGFDESGRAKDIHLRRVTMWYDNGCVTGLKTEYAGELQACQPQSLHSVGDFVQQVTHREAAPTTLT
jgi:hypothetical protein